MKGNVQSDGMNRVFRYLALTLTGILMAFPFWWMLTTAFKPSTRVFDFPPQWFPHPLTLENFVEVIRGEPFFLYYWNSVYIAVIVAVGTCIVASLAGYALARLQFPFKNALFLILLSGMMIPVEVTIVPLFLMMSEIGWVNTHLPLILPPMLGVEGVFGMFLLRQFFITLPRELDEAAKIDGCSPWTTFWRIMLPLAKPALATLVIFAFLNSWNSYLEPLVFLNSKHLYTIPLGLSLFTNQAGTQWHLVMAASSLATIPLLVIFFFAQRQFVEGVTQTGIK